MIDAIEEALVSKRHSSEVPYFDDERLNQLFSDVVYNRRATSHFTDEEVSEDDLRSILELALQAPSGYNLQPWRLIVVKEKEQRDRLKRAAFNQEKISEAPVVVIVVGMKDEIKIKADKIIKEAIERGASSAKSVDDVKAAAFKFLSTMNMDVWVNRHCMIAFTYLMLAAEMHGYDTAPMEGFDPIKVKTEFEIPEEGDVIALLAIGVAKDIDQQHPGRLPFEEVVCSEKFGAPYT